MHPLKLWRYGAANVARNQCTAGSLNAKALDSFIEVPR